MQSEIEFFYWYDPDKMAPANERWVVGLYRESVQVESGRWDHSWESDVVRHHWGGWYTSEGEDLGGLIFGVRYHDKQALDTVRPYSV